MANGFISSLNTSTQSPYVVANKLLPKHGQFGTYTYNAPANANKLGLIVLDTFNLFRKNNMAKIITQGIANGKAIGRGVGAQVEELKIPFQFIEKIPEFNKAANYQEQTDIIGRFEGIDMYSNSSSQDISIELTYSAEGSLALQSDNTSYATTTWTIEYIDVLLGRLKAFVYPSYNQRYYPPMRALLNIGQNYKNVPVLIKSVKIDAMHPVDVFTGKPRAYKVNLDMRVNYPMWQSIDAGDVYTGVNDQTQSVFAYREFSSVQK
jgi:hypothetical protein